MKPRAFVLTPLLDYDFTSLYPRWIETENDIVCIFQNRHPPVWDKKFQTTLISQLENKKFDPLLDYFVITGAFIPITLSCCVLGMLFDDFKILQFWSAESAYSMIHMQYSTIQKESDAQTLT